MRPILDVARELGLAGEEVVPYGSYKAKIGAEATRDRPESGRLILVSALTPTPRGEGKTTVSVALAMGLRRLGRRPIVCLRQPSLGPVFGLKGGGTGGGRAQVVPAQDINLHFTGDMHAVGSAHNLLAALVDNELHFDGPSRIDSRRITWPRVVDMDDRALRNVVVGLGGPSDGVPRESRFDITASSEIMAVLCLARSRDDLRARLDRLVVGRSRHGGFVTASDLGATDALLALLLDASAPNLVQTTEGGPALVHGGPFANIAHGASSVMATRLGLALSDDVITEAGFGFDLGGEKFLHLKCRSAGLFPRCVVLVVTLAALEHHGGLKREDSGASRTAAVERGLAHFDHQVENVRRFGQKPVIALNVFPGDGESELSLVEAHAARADLAVARVTAFADGGRGGEALAHAVAQAVDATDQAPPTPKFLYAPEASFSDKIDAISTSLYGARSVELTAAAERDLERYEKAGYGQLPVCVAKTHLSLTDDPHRQASAGDFDLTVTSIRLAAGAGFLIALMGDISTMPGLPHDPAARHVRVAADGSVTGLMHGE